MNSKWKFYSPDKKLVKSLMTKYGFSELLATILVNRNISTEEDIKIFSELSDQTGYSTSHGFAGVISEYWKNLDIFLEKVLRFNQ